MRPAQLHSWILICILLLSTLSSAAFAQEEGGGEGEGVHPVPLTIQTDKDTYVYGDTIQVEGTATPKATVTVQLWKPDGSLAAINQAETDENGKFTATLYRFMAGDLGGKWKVKAYDPVTGNTAEKEVTLNLEKSDRESPKLTLEISPEKDVYGVGEQVTFTLRSDEKLMEAPTATLTTPCTALDVRFSPSQELEWTGSLTIPECVGTYTLRVEAADQVGNTATATLQFKVEKAAPPPSPPQPPEEEWVEKTHTILENYEVAVMSWQRMVPVTPEEVESWQVPRISPGAKDFKLEISAVEAQNKTFNLWVVRLNDVERLIAGVGDVQPVWKGEGEASYQQEIQVESSLVRGGVALVVENPEPAILGIPTVALKVTLTAKFKWLEPKQPAQPSQPGGPLPAEVEARLQKLEAAVQKLQENVEKLSSKLESLSGEADSLKEEAGKLSRDVDSLKSDTSNLKKADEEKTQVLKNIDQRLASIDSSIQSINVRIAHLQRQADQLVEAHRIPQMAALLSVAALAIAILALVTLRKTLKIVKP